MFGGALAGSVRRHAGDAIAAERLIGPLVAMALLTGGVWLAMVVSRNTAILRQIATAEYYVDYAAHKAPVAEWVERPARTFNNLMQVPMLFYAVCLLMLVTDVVDAAQLRLAWTFVALRLVHALIYMAWNRGPYRFTAWMAGCLTLIVLWTRFAHHSAGLWW